MNGRESKHTSNRIRAIHKAIVNKIGGWGFDVWVSYAKKTKSRYFEFYVCGHHINIRLSDHYSWKAQEFDYDIWVTEPRQKAFNYREFIDDLWKKINAIRGQENARKNSNFEVDQKANQCSPFEEL